MRRRIFFAILIVLTIIMIYDSGIEVRNSLDITVEPKVVQSASASRNDSFTIGTENVEIFELINYYGDVKMVGENRSDIVVDYTITVYEQTEKLAEEYLQQLEIDQHLSDSKIKLKLAQPSNKRYTTGVVSDFVIRAPADLVYQLEASYGSVELENLHGGVTAMINYADIINVQNLRGDTNFVIRFSDGVIKGIDGKFNVDVSYSDLKITEVSDIMNLISRYSDIWISDLSNNIIIDSTYSDLNIENISGSVISNSRFSSVNGVDLDGNQRWEINDGSLKLLP